MEEKYDLTLEWFYFDLAKLKESQVYKIKALIAGSRIGEQMNFCSYAKAYFEPEDIKHSHLIVEPMENYDKNKVNCLIFDLKYNCQNSGFYNKIFIYMNQLKEMYYGYVLYNSETKKCNQKAMIDQQEDYIINNLTKDYFTMFNQDVLEFNLKKYRAIKQYSITNNIHVPTVTEHDEMKQKHIEKQKIGYY